MKKGFLALIFCLSAALMLSARRETVPSGRDTLETADWHWVSLGRGAEAGYAQVHLFGSEQHIAIVRYPMRRFCSEVLSSPGPASAGTGTLAAGAGAVAAVNGSYFTREWGPGTFIKDEGIVAGRTGNAEMFRCNGLLRIGRKMEILTGGDSARVEALSSKVKEALVSGPMLMENGRPVRYGLPEAVYLETLERLSAGTYNRYEAMRPVRESSWASFYNRRHPRTMVGYTRRGMVYFVVVDGRFPGQAEGMTIGEMTQLAQWLGLWDAINLDGGGSSTLWTERTGVLNNPCDNRRFDHEGVRRVPNIVYCR